MTPQATEILTELERRGVLITADGDDIVLKPRRALDDGLLDRVRTAKPAILEVLRSRAVVPTMPPDDVYSVRLRKELLATCTPDYPAGLIPWLDTTHPDLYAALTEALPNEIHRLWSKHAPIPEFDEVLARWLDAHHKAVASYRAENTGARCGSRPKW